MESVFTFHQNPSFSAEKIHLDLFCVRREAKRKKIMLITILTQLKLELRVSY